MEAALLKSGAVVLYDTSETRITTKGKIKELSAKEPNQVGIILPTGMKIILDNGFNIYEDEIIGNGSYSHIDPIA